MNKKFFKTLFVIVTLLIGIHGETKTVQQKVDLINLTGSIQYRTTEKDPWKEVNKETRFSMGCEIKTPKDTKLELGLEPAIIAVLSENSRLGLKKMHINKLKKNVLTHLLLHKGLIWIEMPSYMSSDLFFSIETSSAIIYLRKAVVKVYLKNKSTHVEVYRGAVKARQKGTELEKIVYANKHVVIDPSQNMVDVTDIKGKAGKSLENGQSDVSIAMLAVYSKHTSKQDLEPLSDFIAQEVETQSDMKVLFLDDVRAILSAGGFKRILECTTDSCISTIGGYLGVDRLVIGRLGNLGSKFIFNLKLVDALRDKVIKRTSVTVDHDIGEITQEIPGMVSKLVEKEEKIDIEPVTKYPLVQRVPDSIIKSKAYKNMAWIFPGSFIMGSELNRGDDDEYPQHEVRLKGFFIDKYETTKEEFKRVMGYNPSLFKGCKNCPVENVSWSEAKSYCDKIGKRLPTEAEWEYTCKAGTNTVFYYGNSLSSDQANFDGRKPFGDGMYGVVKNKTLPVGSFKPNAWQLYDMHGNVAEWCLDWYDQYYYNHSPKNSPEGPKKGKYKVVRGGSWKGDGTSLRSTNRNSYGPKIKLNTIGFRCVKDFEE